jgi:hypothetical protein
VDPGREANIGRVLTRNSAFKIQLKAMYIDASLNSVSTILGNLYQSFHEAAVRCLEYVRVLSRVRKTCSSVLISTSILFPPKGRPKRGMHMQSGPVRNRFPRADLIKRVQGYCMGDRG